MSGRPHIGREANPGGLVAHLLIDGALVDSAPLEHETTAGIAHQHAQLGAKLVAAAEAAGSVVTVQIFDGDSGVLVAELHQPPPPDWRPV